MGRAPSPVFSTIQRNHQNGNQNLYANSPAQLSQTQLVADSEGLAMDLVQGDMADLSVFENDSFDLVVHPCANCFVPNALPAWKEAACVMKPAANLPSGIVNPIVYLFDGQLMEKGHFEICREIPYSDLTSLSSEQRQALLDDGEPFCLGHTLADLVGGMLDAGLAITGLFEDCWPDWSISEYIPTFIVTKATKLN